MFRLIWLLTLVFALTITTVTIVRGQEEETTEDDVSTTESPGVIMEVLEEYHDTWYDLLYNTIVNVNWYVLRNLGASGPSPYGLGWPVIWNIWTGRDDSVAEQTANTADSTIQMIIRDPFWAISYLFDSSFLSWTWWLFKNISYYSFEAWFSYMDWGSSDGDEDDETTTTESR